MSDWASLAEAARRLREASTQESLVAVSAESGADELRRACAAIVRLRARLRAGRAAARAPDVEPAADAASFTNTMNIAAQIQQQLQFVAHTESAERLILTAEESELKHELITNLKKLTEVDKTLEELNDTIKEKRATINALRQEWERVCEERSRRAVDASNDGDLEENDETPEKVKLRKTVDKMELSRVLLAQLLTVRSGYDFREDKENLMSLLPIISEPITMESVLKDIQR